MKVKGKICQTGGKQNSTGRYINEDGLTTFTVNKNGEKYEFIILMDGATGLGRNYEITKGSTSAEWYVDFMMAEMQKILTQDPTIPLETVVENCIIRATEAIKYYEERSGMKLEEHEKPSAALSLLRTDGTKTQIYLIGDTETIVGYKNGEVIKVDNPNQKALRVLDQGVINRMAEIARERNCSVLDARTDPEIEEMLQVNRAKKNSQCLDGYWVCGTTPGTAKHGICVEFDNSEIEGIILATDGFDYSMLDLNEEQVYEAVKKYGTDYVSRSIRSVQDNDAQCNKYPRFKKGDDLAVVQFDYLERDISIENKKEEKDK